MKIKFFLYFLILEISLNSFANRFSSLTLVETSLRGIPECLHYRIKGICFWLECSPLGCAVNKTLRVSHYLPDAVAVVYDRYGNNPWSYANTLIAPEGYKLGKTMVTQVKGVKSLGFGNPSGAVGSLGINNRYKEVDIIGNPALELFKKLDWALIPSQAQAFSPYYSSLADALAWRYLGFEALYLGTYIPYLHDIGKPLLNDWGGLYPRNGFIVQSNDAKAAAVLALRAMNIVTQSKQPHLYRDLSTNCGSHCRAAIAKENDSGVQFQWLYPKTESQCIVFGKNDSFSLSPWESAAAVKGHGRYAWIVWRRYEGCIPAKGQFIGQI